MSDSRDLVAIAQRVGATVLPDNAQWTNRLKIKSETSSREYIVAQRKSDGTLGCSCMGWKRFRHCKHTDAIRPILVATNPRGTING
jgi:hypothetical protein